MLYSPSSESLKNDGLAGLVTFFGAGFSSADISDIVALRVSF